MRLSVAVGKRGGRENGGLLRVLMRLTQLKKIDAQLKIIAKGERKGGDPRERELLVAWLGVVAQQNEAGELALIEEHKAAAAEAEKKEDAAAPVAPAAGQ